MIVVSQELWIYFHHQHTVELHSYVNYTYILLHCLLWMSSLVQLSNRYWVSFTSCAGDSSSRLFLSFRFFFYVVCYWLAGCCVGFVVCCHTTGIYWHVGHWRRTILARTLSKPNNPGADVVQWLGCTERMARRLWNEPNPGAKIVECNRSYGNPQESYYWWMDELGRANWRVGGTHRDQVEKPVDFAIRHSKTDMSENKITT